MLEYLVPEDWAPAIYQWNTPINLQFLCAQEIGNENYL